MGSVQRTQGDSKWAEHIRDKSFEPQQIGPLCTIVNLSSRIFAVGMGRQVYQRLEDETWQLVSETIINRDRDALVGFNTLIETEAGLIAAGFSGEIFLYNEGWRLVDSPTKLLLLSGAIHEGRAYLAGIKGTLLRDNGERWESVDLGNFTSDIYHVTSFSGHLFLGTTTGLFVLAEGTVEPIDIRSQTGQERCTWLSSHNGILWAFGGKTVSYSKDGRRWDRAGILDE